MPPGRGDTVLLISLLRDSKVKQEGHGNNNSVPRTHG